MFRVIVNSFAGILMMLVAMAMWNYNPLLSFFLFFASLDQFEDVYYYVSMRRLIPEWMMPIDMIFEGVCAAFGVAMFLFSLIYLRFFQTWFFSGMLILSIPIVWSAFEDIAEWNAVARGGSYEVCATKKFVKKRS